MSAETPQADGTGGTEKTRVIMARPSRPPWKPKFIAALKSIPNVRHACEAASISRSQAYRERQADERFAVAWADAVDEGLDSMERVAHLRATVGQDVTKTVIKTHIIDGQAVTIETTETKERHVSDNLLMFMLKKARPEYRESFRVESTGPDGGPIRHEVTTRDEAVGAFYAKLDQLGQPDPD